MKQFFRSLPIKTKMFITFASVSLVVIIISGIVIYVSNVNEMKNQTQSMSKVLSTQSSRTIDMYFKDIERLSLAVFTDPFVQETLAEYEFQSFYNDTVIKNEMFPSLFNLAYPRPDLEGITVYTNAGTVFDYHKTGDIEIRYEAVKKNWMKSLDQLNKTSFLLLPTREATRLDGSQKNVVSFVRHIYEIPQREKIGSVKIDINIEVFEQMLEIGNVGGLEEYLRILVLSENRTVIFDDRNKLIGEQRINLAVPRAEEGEPKEGTLSWGSDSYLYANDHSNFTNWDTVILIDNQFIINERNRMLVFIGLSGLAVIVMMAIISYFLSYNITRPLTAMMKKMKRVEKGDLAERMELTGSTDIDVLTRGYNSMLDSINKLIAEVYESSITEKNAKISALQSQINPHFLYNTLNVMKSISRIKGVEEVAEISESLADLFKYSMKNLDRQVHLHEEVTHIENYMRIQQYRFMNRFTFEQYISNEVKSAFIPKLLIQPLIENAIGHGLAGMKNNGVIQLHVDKQEDQLVIEVKDNGVGMSEEVLVKVKENLKDRMTDLKDRGIGLHNIAQRIRLMYGYQYGVEIQSTKNKGTTIRIAIPFKRDNF